MKAGVIDPVKVVKSSLRYGSGVASLLLSSTDVAIVNKDLRRNEYHHEDINV